MTFRLTRRLVLAALALGLGAAISPSAGPARAGEPIRITILGVGDIYDFDARKGRGGVARLNAVARAERAANPNTLYVMDGDMLSPSILSGIDKGANMIALTNVVPFDLAVPGNHEFDFGPEVFLQRMKESKYPWAAINIRRKDGSSVPGLGGVTWKEMAGLKIALVPVAQDTTPIVSSSGDLVFLPTVETALAAAKQARGKGADLVIGVVQTDRQNDRALIGSHAFDVIVSGDDHAIGSWYDGRTAYVETGIDGRFLVPLDLYVTIGEKHGKRKVKWVPRFRFIDTAAVAPDPETEKLVEAYRARLDESLSVPVGRTEVPLDSRRAMVRSVETTMGDLVADAMRWATGADIAITNGGGIRGDRTYEPGTVLTRKDILTELPFGNKTVVTEIPGSQVLAALENGFSQVEKGAGRFPQVSGLTVVWDPAAPPGRRVVSVAVNGQPLEPDRLYKVATNDYMLRGGDGYGALGGGRVLVDAGNGTLMANDVMRYIEAVGGVKTPVEGRIRRVGEK